MTSHRSMDMEMLSDDELPSYIESEGLSLRMSQSNPCRCTFFYETESLYVVSMSSGMNPVITIKRAETGGEVIGTIEWNDALGDKIAVVGREPKRFRPFFNRPLLGGGETAKMEDESGATWTWHGYKAGGALTLISPSNEIAAAYRRPNKKPTLTIYPSSMRIRDLVVISFVALEKNRLEKDKAGGHDGYANAMMNTAAGLGGASSGVV